MPHAHLPRTLTAQGIAFPCGTDMTVIWQDLYPPNLDDLTEVLEQEGCW